ncbi:MAG: hypothetical protein GKR89_29955 [Candidatus Latescibacteria bacterium]|nr:hypothetical protein [Candidatus Latescibacterota bacterium]
MDLMKRLTCNLIGIWLVVLVGGWAPEAWGLTIVRIGGENAPPPAVEGDFDFVQMTWADIEEASHGSSDLIKFDADFIEPDQLDPNVNLTPLLEELGGQILNLTWIGFAQRAADDVFVFDQDPSTYYLGDGHFASHGPNRKHLVFDLGGAFLVDRIRFYPRQERLADRFVERFIIGINDGNPLKDGSRQFNVGTRGSFIDFDIAYSISENTEAIIDLEMPDVPVQRILFQAPENTRGVWEIAEFEIYGTGFAPAAEYLSNVIDLGAPAALGQLQWVGETQEQSNIDLSMRSGVDEDPNTYWRLTFRGDERTRFDERGRALNLVSYGKLGRGEQAGVTHDTESWDFWGTPYEFAAAAGAMSGSRPQQYVQFRADFASSENSGGRLEYLQFSASIPPVASQALAEITPLAVPAGQASSFTYKIKPNFRADDLGFDSIAIDTPTWPEGVDAVRVSGQEVDIEDVQLNENGLVVRIPRIDIQRTEELIEIEFRSQVFKFGTVFSGRIFDSTRPNEVHQGLTPGDADPLEDGNRLSVDLANFTNKTIQSLRLSTAAFTPNSDGINDRLQLEYELLNLVGGVQVEVKVYDLAGRSLGTVFQDQAASGEFIATWDGRDGGGQLLPPGLYIVRLEVDADQGQDVGERVVSLVY